MQDLTPHPLRGRALQELHSRPFFPVTTPRRFLHFAFLTTPDQAADARAALAGVCDEIGALGPAEHLRYYRVDLGPAVLRWERHGEFTTYSWEFPGGFDSDLHEPFGPPPAAVLNLIRMLPQPGPHLVSTDLHLLPETDAPRLEDVFDASSLAASIVDQGGAMVATDFRPAPDGSVRILIVDIGLTGMRAGALAQRMLEIDTYRMLALLGLPEAQRLLPVVRRIEDELARIASAMTASTGLEGDHLLLENLTAMAAALEADAAGSSFRLGASRAYDQLVAQRLATIGEARHGGWPTIASFLARRLAPAIRSCRMVQDRQVDLAAKLARSANLLDTRVDVAIEQQNRDLLRSMNDRTRLQLRMQQTVEGLSIAAISYYVIALLMHVLEGLHDAHLLPVDTTIATACLVPVVIVAVAFVVGRIRRRHMPHD